MLLIVTKCLTKQECIDVILLAGTVSTRQVAATFNPTHQTMVAYDTVAMLIKKFKTMGSIEDQPRYGPPRTITNKETLTMVLANVAKSL